MLARRLVTSVLALVSLFACSSSGSMATSETVTEPSGTTPAARTRSLCFVSCNTTDDCEAKGGGTCTNGMCILGGGACKTDPDCIPYGSGFASRSACSSSAECGPNELCIAFQGKGICQPAPTSASPCSEQLETVAISWPSIEGPTVTVCGRTSSVCDGGECRSGCSSDADCTKTSYPNCDVARHKCVCEGHSCAGGASDGEVCLPDGRCGCHADTDCPAKQGFDTCYGDTCGCSGTSACAGIVQGATFVCAPKP